MFRVLKILVAAVLIWSGHAWADVDPDCFAGQDSITCALNRIDDAKDADRLFAPVIEKSGWAEGCFTVQYIEGDNGGPDTLMVMLYGPKGGSAPACHQVEAAKLGSEPERRLTASGAGLDEYTKATANHTLEVWNRGGGAAGEAASVAQRKKIGRDLKRALSHAPKVLREELLKHTNKLTLGSGYSEGVELPLP